MVSGIYKDGKAVIKGVLRGSKNGSQRGFYMGSGEFRGIPRSLGVYLGGVSAGFRRPQKHLRESQEPQGNFRVSVVFWGITEGLRRVTWRFQEYFKRSV